MECTQTERERESSNDVAISDHGKSVELSDL